MLLPLSIYFLSFLNGFATEHLIAPGILPEHLNDTRIGRVLDKLYDYRITKIFVTVALEVVRKFSINLSSVHLDSTSIRVEGQYLQEETLRQIEKNLVLTLVRVDSKPIQI